MRQIRTAGRGSGSIEVTLPSVLRSLVGLSCRVTLRDGARPDIVLQPDLRQAHAAFVSVWRAMAGTLLGPSEELPPFPVASFGFGLQHRDGSADVPFLCWHDGLALASALLPPPQAVSRVVAALGQALAAELAITPYFAADFGAACGFLAGGVAPSFDGQAVCDRVAAALPGVSRAVRCGDVRDDAFWIATAPLLLAVAKLFRDWAVEPAGRGMAVALSGH